jgi:formate C-acetyltransferase
MLAGDAGLAHAMCMLKTLCTLDVYHAQFNVIHREILLDAQKHPEKHRDLLIRVAGYTAFFVELGKEVQDEIIGRTAICCWNGESAQGVA